MLVRPREIVRAAGGWDVEIECPACGRVFRETFTVDTRFATCTCNASLDVDVLSLFSSSRFRVATPLDDERGEP